MCNNDYDKQKIRNVNTIRKNRQGRVKLIEKKHTVKTLDQLNMKT